MHLITLLLRSTTRTFSLKKLLNILQYTGLPIPIVAVSAAVSHEQYGINDRYANNCTYITVYVL